MQEFPVFHVIGRENMLGSEEFKANFQDAEFARVPVPWCSTHVGFFRAVLQATLRVDSLIQREIFSCWIPVCALPLGAPGLNL